MFCVFFFNCSDLKDANSKPVYKAIFSNKSRPFTVGKCRIYFTNLVF